MTRVLIVAAVSSKQQAREDKVSLPQQEADGLAHAEGEGWEVVEVIRIPGFSRRFYTLAELVEHASARGVQGPARLHQHMQDKDFDVLWVRSTNRFGREQSINAEVINRVIQECQARIYSQLDGWIDKANRRAMAAITGYRDSSEIDELLKKRADAIVAQAKRGIPVSTRVPFSHRIVRNPDNGRAIRVDVREELRPLFNDLATLLLEGVSYNNLAAQLFLRFGHTTPDGKPYFPQRIARLPWNPIFWGNNAIRWQHNHQQRYERGLYMLENTTPAPEAVSVFYGVCTPVYTGALAEQVKAELRRRTERFGVPKQHTGRFTALVICDGCGNRMTYMRLPRSNGVVYTYLVCPIHGRKTLGYPPCPQPGHIPEHKLLAWLETHLNDWLHSGRVDLLPSPKPESHEQARQLEDAKTRLQRRLETLIAELSDVEADLKEDFRRQIRHVKDELLRCEAQLNSLRRRERQAASAHAQQQSALHEVTAKTLERFWQQEPLPINQLLRRLLAGAKIVVQKHDAIGFSVRDRRL